MFRKGLTMLASSSSSFLYAPSRLPMHLVCLFQIEYIVFERLITSRLQAPGSGIIIDGHPRKCLLRRGPGVVGYACAAVIELVTKFYMEFLQKTVKLGSGTTTI